MSEDGLQCDARDMLADEYAGWASAFAGLLPSPPRLPIRPDPKENPNRQDFLMRLAAANGLKGIPELCRILGTSYSVLALASPDTLSAFLGGGTLDAGPSAKHTLAGVAAAKRGLSLQARVCPACIAADAPMAQEFNLALPVPCAAHSILPIDKCPECMKPLSYFRPTVERCVCGFPLARCQVQPTPPWLQLFFAVFAPWHVTTSPNLTFETTLIQDLQAARACAALFDWTSRMRTARVILEDFGEIEGFMSRWPASFAEALNGKRESSIVLPEQLLKPYLDSAASMLRNEALIRQQAWRSDMARKETNADGDLEPGARKHVSSRDIRRIANLDFAAALEWLAQSGARPCSASEPGTFSIEARALLALQRHFSETMSLDDAAAQLCCSPALLRGLAKAGVVEAKVLSVKPRSPRFEPASIEKFLVKLRRQAIAMPPDLSGLVPIVQVPMLHHDGQYREEWLLLVKELDADNAVLYSPNRCQDLSQTFVKGSDLERVGFTPYVLRRCS